MRTECKEPACSHGVIGRYRGHGEPELCGCEGGYEYYCDHCEEPITEEEHELHEGHCPDCYIEEY